MKRCSAKPYEGDEKYIFVSYCHKDKEMVFPIIEQLVKDGYRIWYDEGIDPGTEWPEIIAQHLNECSAVLAFITENSLNSHNCRREISFALLKKKLFISIILEPVKMSPGIEMQLSATQSIYKYKLDYEDEFYNKINNTSLLDVCKDMNRMAPSPSPIPKPKPTPKPEPTSPPEPTPPPYISLKKLLYIIVSIVVVIIAAIAGFVIYNHKDNIDIAGTTEAISVSNEISEMETTFETTTTEVTTTEEKYTDENTEGSILEESATNETTTKPTTTKPTATKPTATEPTATEPTATEPTATEPTTAKPTTTKPTTTKPTTTKPTATEPTTAKPTTTKPTTTTKPVVTTTESTTTQKLYANLSFKVPNFPIYTDHNGTFTLTTNANVDSVKIYDIVDGKNGGSMSMKKSGNSWIATANIYIEGNHAVTAYVKLLDGTELKSNTVYFSYPY